MMIDFDPTTTTPTTAAPAVDPSELRAEVEAIYRVARQRGSTDHAIVEACTRTVRLRQELREAQEQLRLLQERAA